MLEVRSSRASNEASVLELWGQCELVSWEDPVRAIRRKVDFQPDLFLVAVLEGRLVGTVMGGYEGRRGWTNHLGVAPDYRRQGIARSLMQELERRLRSRGCPKLNLQVRRRNDGVLGFYRRMGYA